MAGSSCGNVNRLLVTAEVVVGAVLVANRSLLRY